MFNNLFKSQKERQKHWTAEQWKNYLLDNSHGASERADIVAIFAREEPLDLREQTL